LTPDTLTLIKDDVDLSVGFIRTRSSGENGFRVGENLLMTAYHVLNDEIGEIS